MRKEEKKKENKKKTVLKFFFPYGLRKKSDQDESSNVKE